MKNAKAYVALVGSMATGMLGVYGPDTNIGRVLTVIVAATTAVATWRVPNAKAE